MRKIPTLFERKFDDSRVKEVLPVVTKGMEWVLDGDGIATIKYDGACCAIIKGEFYIVLLFLVLKISEFRKGRGG